MKRKTKKGEEVMTEKKMKSREMKVVYGVKWLEVEFGQRDEGWALYLDKDRCFKEQKKASRDGAYPSGGGYCGPERPVEAVEIPFSSLDKKLQAALRKGGKTHTENHWEPPFRGKRHLIEG